MGPRATWAKTPPPLGGGVFVPRVGPRATSKGGGAAGAAPHPRRTPARGCIMDPMSVILISVHGPVEDRDALHTMVSVLGYGLEWRADGPGELVAYQGGYRVSSVSATGDVWGWLQGLKRCGRV